MSDKIRPEFVVSSEPTDGGLTETKRTYGDQNRCYVSAMAQLLTECDNAIYKMVDILRVVRALNNNAGR